MVSCGPALCRRKEGTLPSLSVFLLVVYVAFFVVLHRLLSRERPR
jgi:hypothetical protein